MRKLRRLLLSDNARAAIYLAAGAVLLFAVFAGFGAAWEDARNAGTRDPLAAFREPTPTPLPERMVPPAEITYPFF
ncbi:MAG: hypothetical protein PWP23_895 [Candidatus Sumerlaeota bacterium]|nr:hypothetical protein [Candidatus Sumerlaeota bacterium]